jgi:hypothetical protein
MEESFGDPGACSYRPNPWINFVPKPARALTRPKRNLDDHQTTKAGICYCIIVQQVRILR